MKTIQLNFFARSALAAAGALALSAAFDSAHADTVLDFTASGGTTSTTPTSTQTDFILTLNTVNGMSESSFSVAQGDVIDATISFNPVASIAIPSNADYTNTTLSLSGTGFDGSPVNTSYVSVAATLGGVSAGGSAYDGCGTSNAICDPGLYIAPGSVTTFSFDTYKSTFTVSTLASPVTINSANFLVFTQVSAVPEPQTFALMAAGLGMLWLVVRRRNGSSTMSLARAA